jgi:phytoene/squalene synthetase
MPMVHKNRYLAALHLPAHMRPPVCLRYAIWATAASMSDKYRQYDDMLYERARRYIDQAEMKVGLNRAVSTF